MPPESGNRHAVSIGPGAGRSNGVCQLWQPHLDRDIPGRLPSEPPASNGPSGVAYMVQAAFWFAVMAVVVKLCGRSLPAIQIVFARACFTFVISGALLLRLPASTPRLGRRRGTLLLRGALGSCGLLCFYFAVVHMPIAEATVIHQTNPLFTALLASWLLGEHLNRRVLGSVLLGLAGVACIAQPSWLAGDTTSGDGSPTFALVALAGALFAAAAYVTVRNLGRSEHPFVVVFYFPLVTVPLVAPFALTAWQHPTATEWLLLILVGVTTQLGQVALTRGLAREPAGKATSIGYLQVAFATILGGLFFAEWPDLLGTCGIVLICCGLYLATRKPCN